MKASEIVESIKEVLGMELTEVKVELEERELDNGTKITADKFEEGESVFILTESGDEEEKIALPVGNYEMNDGTVLVVTEEGKIGELREASDEVPQKEEAGEEKEEMNEEEEMDEEADVADWQGMEKRIQNLEDAIADLKANKLNDNEEMYSKEKKDEKVEASKVDSNKLDLSAEPISHNPEKEVKKERVKLGNNRPMTTRDRIIQIINNN
tara:strand:+ start:390 stop:1022 length:633 start_codon:yes stop_codon:yes gene_type:complete